MSSALVPRLILLEASTSALWEAPSILSSLSRPALGEIWSSAMGGGLGSLGELDGEAIAPCQSAQKKKKGRLPALGKINMRSQLLVFLSRHAIRRDLSTPNPTARHHPTRAPASSLDIYSIHHFAQIYQPWIPIWTLTMMARLCWLLPIIQTTQRTCLLMSMIST
jgi:hypothetical protein